MYYNVNMIYYEEQIKKIVKKGEIPLNIFNNIHNAFIAMDVTKDLNLFDIKKLKGEYKKNYFRLRKGKYSAIFDIEKGDFYVIYIGKREEVYDSWQ